MFRLNRNERSHWSGNGVHVESELVFMIGRNMQLPGISRQEHSGWLAAADLLRSEGLVDIAEYR